MRRVIQKFLILTTVAIGTTLLSGCPTDTKRVLVIGDSITHGSAGAITQVGGDVMATDPVNRITFTIIATGTIGARQTSVTQSDPEEYWPGLIANSIHTGNFDAIVVELGTNDCSSLGSAAGDYQPDIERIVSAISLADPDVAIFWLTMQQVPTYLDCAAMINSSLGQIIIEAGTYPNLKTFSYGLWAEAHPECFKDGIHPRSAWNNDPSSGGTAGPVPAGYCDGQRSYAVWLKFQLDGYFGPPEPTQS